MLKATNKPLRSHDTQSYFCEIHLGDSRKLLPLIDRERADQIYETIVTKD